MDRRSFVIGTAASATTLAAWPSFAQETYPTHAVTIINAFPPGGANDIVTRPLAASLEPILKQPVVIETKAGAAGQVGAQVAASAKPDGYTLLSHNNGISGYAEVDKLFGRAPKTTRADFIPIARLTAALFREANPVPVKYALSLLKFMSPKVRLPLVELTDLTKAEVAAAITRACDDYADYIVGKLCDPEPKQRSAVSE